jgi:hypothetical protein
LTYRLSAELSNDPSSGWYVTVVDFETGRDLGPNVHFTEGPRLMVEWPLGLLIKLAKPFTWSAAAEWHQGAESWVDVVPPADGARGINVPADRRGRFE